MNNKLTARKIVDDLLNKTQDGQEVDLEYLKDKLNSFDEDIKSEALKILESSVQPVITKQQDKIVRVSNFPDPVLYPSEIKVNNLAELKEEFKSIEEAIKNIPVPVINIPENPVFPEIPQTIINLEPLIQSLEDNLKILKKNSKSNPLAVRLTDGAEWIKELIKVQKETSKAVTAFAGGSDRMILLDSNRNPVNPASNDSPSTIYNGKTTVTTAGTRVVLASSTAIKSVTVKALAANTGTIFVGNASVASTNGYALAAGQAISFDIDNLTKVNLDSSVSAESVTYLAVN